MTITAEQREQRRQWVGASDVAAICGLDPYRTAHDVWIEKVYPTIDTTSEPADLGNWLEGPLVRWANETLHGRAQYGPSFIDSIGGVDNCITSHHPTLPMAANPDGLFYDATNTPILIEAKTAGLSNPMFRAAEEGWTSDSVPHRVIVQVHAQMMCVGDDCQRAYVAALVAGMGRKLYTIERNDEWCDGIAKRVTEFWERVENKQPPPERPSLGVAKRIIREPEKTVSIDADLVATWLAYKSQMTRVKEANDSAYADILAALGDADAGLYEDGGEQWLVTYYANKRGVRTLRTTKSGTVL